MSMRPLSAKKLIVDNFTREFYLKFLFYLFCTSILVSLSKKGKLNEMNTEMFFELLLHLRADLEDIVRVCLGDEDDYEGVVHLWLQLLQF